MRLVVPTAAPLPPLAARSGQIRFLKKGPQRCTVKLTISYEVPSVLAPFASVRGVLVHAWGAAVGAVERQLAAPAARLTPWLLTPLPSHPAPCHRSTPQLLTPVVESILQKDMQRFAEYALQHQASMQA